MKVAHFAMKGGLVELPVYSQHHWDAGEVSMQKVKVTRYVSGRRPEYAPEESSDESSEEEEGFGEGVRGGEEGEAGETGEVVKVEVKEEDWRNDPRLRRLRERRAMADSGRYAGTDGVVVK